MQNRPHPAPCPRPRLLLPANGSREHQRRADIDHHHRSRHHHEPGEHRYTTVVGGNCGHRDTLEYCATMGRAAAMVVDAVVCMGAGCNVPGFRAVVPSLSGNEVGLSQLGWVIIVHVLIVALMAGCYWVCWRADSFRVRFIISRRGINETKRVRGQPCSSSGRCLPEPRPV